MGHINGTFLFPFPFPFPSMQSTLWVFRDLGLVRTHQSSLFYQSLSILCITKIIIFPGHLCPYHAIKEIVAVLATVIAAPTWAKGHIFFQPSQSCMEYPCCTSVRLLHTLHFRCCLAHLLFTDVGQADPIITSISTQGQKVITPRLFFNGKLISSFWGKKGKEWGKRKGAKATENDGQLVDKGSTEVEMKAFISLQKDKFVHCTRMSHAVIIKRIKDT